MQLKAQYKEKCVFLEVQAKLNYITQLENVGRSVRVDEMRPSPLFP
jgi:hypothetical protein